MSEAVERMPRRIPTHVIVSYKEDYAVTLCGEEVQKLDVLTKTDPKWLCSDCKNVQITRENYRAKQQVRQAAEAKDVQPQLPLAVAPYTPLNGAEKLPLQVEETVELRAAFGTNYTGKFLRNDLGWLHPDTHEWNSDVCGIKPHHIQDKLTLILKRAM